MIDPYIAQQVAARNAPSVAKTRFLTLRSSYPTGYVVAVEGDVDKAVYAQWIRRVNSVFAYEFLVLRGKRQVRQLKNALTRDLGGASADVMYLVDRDFDDLAGFSDTANVFMTDRYSIENYLVDPLTIAAALPIAYPCQGYLQVRENIVARYRTDLQGFLDALQALNFRVYSSRRLGLDVD